MPYKIVETVESGRPTLTTVPDNWEKNGVLFWPFKKADKLRKRHQSQPDESWMKMPCKIKRTDLPTFQSGEEELFSMCCRTDTEEEVPRTMTSEQPEFDIPPQSFDTIAEECQINMDSYNVMANESEQTCYEIIQPYEVPTQSSCSCNFREMLLNMERKIEEQNRVVLKKMAGLEAALEIINKKIGKYGKKENNKQSFEENLEKISSLKELQTFEDKLKLGESTTGLENQCISICGMGKGICIAYRLVDVLFSREFLTQCSWSGGSRGNGPKICFKVFQHTIMFFFNVIYRLDNSFTLHECNEFFKNILRYSKQRNSAMGLRMSVPKRRPKQTQLQLPKVPAPQVDPSVAVGDNLPSVSVEPPEFLIDG